MSVLAALLPPVVVCVAFVAILLGVKRYADRESRDQARRNAPLAVLALDFVLTVFMFRGTGL